MLLPAALKTLTVPLVLGSGSASRAAILRELGLKFDIQKPDIDEKAIRFDDPAELVLALGLAKAAAMLEGARGDALRKSRALLITGDQVRLMLVYVHLNSDADALPSGKCLMPCAHTAMVHVAAHLWRGLRGLRLWIACGGLACV